MSMQVIPDPVKPFLIFWVLSPNSHNIHRITIHDILNPRNLYFYLIKNLPNDSSPYFNKENNVFIRKLFSNLVFGDDFAFNGIISMSRDLFFVSGTKCIPLNYEE